MSTPTARQTALTYQIAALTLGYPDDDLLARLPQLRAAAQTLPDEHGDALTTLVDHLGGETATSLAADYVALFDLRRRCCPYLTYFAHGDTRKRGVALLQFKSAYRRAGLELSDEELPDHVCVVLEFAATADLDAGRKLLLNHRAGLELLRLALRDAGSPYAHALSAVSATLPRLRGDEHDAVARLAAEGPPAEEVGLEPFAPPEYMGART